ncbi:hypothetical protein PAPHI01_2241 [Pancytospora philotis]|nr:hypothetical protein PAPHI01_2241 [Pancytospora philotis]
MLQHFVCILPLLHCTPASRGVADIINGHALADYATFGAQEIMTLSALEGQTLDALRTFCMASDNPEVPETIASASARWVAPRDKARCVVLSVLSREDPLALLSQLMARTGFASHWLLGKIFHEDFVKSLRSESPVDTAIDDQFDKAIEKHMAKLGPVGKYISECALTATKMDFGDYVAQNGDRDTGFDFGVLGVRMLAYKCDEVFAEFPKQIELWLAGESINEKLLATACEFTRVILHSDLPFPNGIKYYKAYIAESVACRPQNELLRLFDAFHDAGAVQTCITKILNDSGYRRISPDFFLNYVKWLKTASSSSSSSISTAWQRYIEDGYALSHALQTCKDPQSFVEDVPRLLLHDSLVRLHAETDNIPRRDEAAGAIVKNLDYYTFTRILIKAKPGAHRPLMHFVLNYLDDGAKATYFAATKHVKGDKSKNRTKKYTTVFRDIEQELRPYASGTWDFSSVPRAV